MGEVGYKTLAIDIETFSDVDLIKCGARGSDRDGRR